MKAALIYPPFVSEATSPPLGVNLLKAYLERETDAEVRVFDLNIEFYHHALKNIGSLDLYPESVKGKAISTVKQAADLFLPPLKQDFFDQKAYDLRGTLFIDFFNRSFRSDFSRLKQARYSAAADTSVSMRELLRPVMEYKPDIAGFSVMYTPQSPYSVAMAGILKEKGIPSIFGGAKVSFFQEMFERYLGKGPDYLLSGEGETGLTSLISWYDKGGRPEDVPGLTWKDKGMLMKNRCSDPADMNSIPAPDFSDLDLNRYFSPLPVLPVLSSRGCSWQRCVFCNHHKTYLRYRPKKIGPFVEEIKALSEKHEVNHFYFCDEMMPAKRLLQASSMLKGTGISYLALAKPLADFNAENLRKVAEGGCRMLLWGVESGSQQVLDRMQKGTDAATCANVLKMSRNSGITNFIYLISGFPSETLEEHRQTLQFLEQNSGFVDFLISSPFALEQNAPIFKEPERFGIKDIKKRQLNDFQFTWDFRRTRGMTDEQVKGIDQKRFYRFNRYPLAFTRLRDHLLLYVSREYDHQGSGKQGNSEEKFEEKERDRENSSPKASFSWSFS
ncbi:radical SAM protein [Candidatus Woesearchaeota archaeon]|nr:radical SAM protein [Candidatus Woesearchaeota archaeon]